MIVISNRNFSYICTTKQYNKFEEFHQLVRLNGWVKLRQMGISHIIYKKGNQTYPVPYHKGKELGKGLEAKMRKEMKHK